MGCSNQIRTLTRNFKNARRVPEEGSMGFFRGII